jgi:hypothetical protein
VEERLTLPFSTIVNEWAERHGSDCAIIDLMLVTQW